jgi:hypothetical protein
MGADYEIFGHNITIIRCYVNHIMVIGHHTFFGDLILD